MLSGLPMPLDLKEEKQKQLSFIPKELHQYIIDDDEVTEITYPVITYPFKIPNKNSLSFQKNSVVECKLMGIKGQYLILDDDRVFNVRKHEGYIIDYKVSTDDKKPTLERELKYNYESPVISSIERVTKPGRRIFSSAQSLPKINNGLGIAIVSTPKGVMSDIDARKNKIGGEIICKVF